MSIIVARKAFVMIHFGNMWTKSSKISRNRSGGRYPSHSGIFWKPTSFHMAMSIWRGCLMRTNFLNSWVFVLAFTSIPMTFLYLCFIHVLLYLLLCTHLIPISRLHYLTSFIPTCFAIHFE
ncbi:hypothetical protein J3R30DRAFT_3681038 [Lentinula aciculospora]|uniref:Uncharacterized protein n=1 Tax=Lentinula aciculospora TaxID=153920 RepID=A0A9W9AIS9_9AGAR|nr:hypothetical protein J3R30DRAFT_3681038 [Lentinula aciculospora]